jgi:hypothetical protein
MKQLIFSFLGRRRRRKKISFPRPSVRVPGNLRLGDDGLSLFDLQHVSNHQFSYPFFLSSSFFRLWKKKKMGCVSACIEEGKKKKDERVMWRIVGGFIRCLSSVSTLVLSTSFFFLIIFSRWLKRGHASRP